MEFKKIDGTKVDLVNYVRDYMKIHPQSVLLVGCDSQNTRKVTSYAVVVAFYNPGHGAHVIFRKWNTPKEKVRPVRLINEVWNSIETAEEIKNAGLPRPKWIDLDLNPNPKFKSNEVFKTAVGLCEGMGYEVRFKSLGPLVTTMADSIART